MKGALAALALAAGITLAASVPADAAEPCGTSPELLESRFALPRTGMALAGGRPLTIVALGSSSTQGIGASDPSHAYPAVLERQLAQRFPRSPITVLNRGVGGQDADQMLARLDADVFAESPDLVVWQTGTNSALRDSDVEEFTSLVLGGVRRMQEAGIDVLLMGVQRSPKVDVAPHRLAYAENLRVLAELSRVPFLPRYEIMSAWLDQGRMTMDEMIDRDGLHMTDRSYLCLAEAAAGMIANLARAPIASR